MKPCFGDPEVMETKDWKDRLLALPMFYKIFAANSAIVVVGAVFGTLITARVAGNTGASLALVLVFAMVGLLLSLTVNLLVLRAAFVPFDSLERVLDEVRHGNLAARVRRGTLSDPDIDRMADTLNQILDAVERYSQRVKDLSRQVLAAQEAERLRIARELHDDTAQSLTYMLLRMKVAERVDCAPAVQETLEELCQLATKTLEDIKRMAVELRPAALDENGLIAALEAHLREFQARVGTPVEFELDSLAERLPRDTEVVVYRVVQEALTNIAKYAAASRVEVKLHQERDGGLSLLVRDNGKGFDVEAARNSRSRGLGLFGMQERVELVGGRIEWRSVRGQGTEVRAWIPLTPGKGGPVGE